MSDEVTAVEISRMAGVSRAAVSNWRARNLDFPPQSGGTPNSPTFDRTQVEEWLAGRQSPAKARNTDVLVRLVSSLTPDGGPGADPADGSLAPGSAEVITCIAPSEPPPAGEPVGEFGQPSRTDPALAWVQVCVAYLRQGGTAVVAVPLLTAVRPSGRRTRAELLRAGVLQQVVELPELPGGPWQIWVLTRPVQRPAYQIRMVDLSGPSSSRLPRTVADWAAVYADERRSREVPSIELLDDEVLLLPSARVGGEPEDIRSAYDAARVTYAGSVKHLPAQAPELSASASAPLWPLITITELIRNGALAYASSTEAGDVVLSSRTGDPTPRVATEATDDGYRTITLRCRPELLDPYFLAGFLAAEVNRRQSPGTSSSTSRLDVRRARVPRMPLTEQRRYGDAFRELAAFEAIATSVAGSAQDFVRTAVQGLTAGAFAPQASRKRTT